MKPLPLLPATENNALLLHILHNIDDAAFITDAHFTIAWRNTISMQWGSKAEPWLSNFMDVIQLVSPGNESVNFNLAEALKNQSKEATVQLQAADGRSLQLSCYIHRQMDTHAVSAIVFIIRDPNKNLLQQKNRLLNEKVQAQEQINRLIVSAQDDERNELGKELQDDINQVLSSAKLLLQYARDNKEHSDSYLTKSSEYIDMAIEKIRRMTQSLSSSLIDDVGLKGPVEEVIDHMIFTKPVAVQFNYDDKIEHMLTSGQKALVYRIVQEQLDNIIRHADAKQVSIVMLKKDDLLHLTISDDGKGFDLSKQIKGGGLAGINSRVEAARGSFFMQSSPGKGCRLAVSIPLSESGFAG
jgi:signal transduction histidine kinase